MNALYFLIPMSLLILVGAVAIFLWSLRRGQYEDMESPAHSILIDDREQSLRIEAKLAEKSAAAEPPSQQTPP